MKTAVEHKSIIQTKDLLHLRDLSAGQLADLLDSAAAIKQKWANKEDYQPLKGKILGMIFEKSSTRTRVSFEAGMLQLGGHAMFLSSNDLQIGRGETVSDTAKVLSEYLDGIMIRTFEHEKIEELSAAASIPVINGLTDLYHPCQALADLLTIKEIKGQLSGLKLAYIGDGNNVLHSLMVACAKTGMNLSVAAPEGYLPNGEITRFAQGEAEKQGGSLKVLTSPEEAITDADIVYADVWTSMGQEAENAVRLKVFEPYQINKKLTELAKPDFLFLHCLPAHRGEEVTADVIDGPNSAVFHQAGNRLHAQKAVLVDLLGRQ